MDVPTRPSNLEIVTGTARVPLRSLTLEEMWHILQKVLTQIHPCIRHVHSLKTLGRHLEEVGTFDNLSFHGGSSITSRAICLDPSRLTRTRSKMLFLAENRDVFLYDAVLEVREDTRKIHQKSVAFHLVTQDQIQMAKEDTEPWSWLNNGVLCDAIFELDSLLFEAICNEEQRLATLKDRIRLIRTVIQNIDNTAL